MRKNEKIKGDKTFKKGEQFTHKGFTYEVTKIPTFSTVIGENIDPQSTGAFMVKVPLREVERV